MLRHFEMENFWITKIFDILAFSLDWSFKLCGKISSTFALLKWWEFETKENGHIFNHKILALRPYIGHLLKMPTYTQSHHIWEAHNTECLSDKRILWIHTPRFQQCKIGGQRNFKYSLFQRDNLCSDVTTKVLTKYKHE